MADTPGAELADAAAAELHRQGKEHYEPALRDAVAHVAATHGHRPIDEIEAVLMQAILAATNGQANPSPESIHSMAERISHERPPT